MALLDDLKKQAQEKSAQHSQDLSKTLQQDEFNWHTIAPKLFIMLDYFKDLVETLNVVEPDALFNFNLTKNITFRNLKKRNFRISKDKQNSARSFSFRYDLVGDHALRVAVRNEAMGEKLRNILNGQNLKFSEVSEGQGRAQFLIKPLFVTRFNYAADVKNCLITLDIENFDGIWTQNLRYQPDAINDQLLDETAKYVLGEENKFMELSGYSMPDELRQKLQEKLGKGKNPAGQVKGETAEQPGDKPDKNNNFMKIFKKSDK